MSDIAKNCRSKPVEPSISSLVRTFAPSSSTVDRGSSLPSDTHDTKLRVNPAKISDVLSGNALAVLKDVAEMFDSVPYIKAAAGFVIWIFEIRDELSDLGDKWEEFEKKLNGVVKILRNVRRDHENFKSEANLPEDLKQDLYDMATNLLLIQQALQPYTTHKSAFWKSISSLIQRKELIKQVEKCSRDLDTCVQNFWTSSMAHLRLQNARPVNHVVADKLPLTPQTSALTLPMRAARPLDVRSPPRLEQNAAHTPAASNRKSSPSRSHAPPPERSHVDHGHQRSHRVAESATLTSLPKPKQEQSSRAPSNDQKSDGQKPNGDTYAEKLRGFPELIRAYDRVPWAQKGIPEMDHRIVGSSSGSAGPINGTLTRTTITTTYRNRVVKSRQIVRRSRHSIRTTQGPGT